MSGPLVVSIPHNLGKEEAARRLKNGFGQARANFAQFLTIEEDAWAGDHLNFQVRALGQSANGAIDVMEDQVRLEVTLPWLLGKIAERFVPTIRNEAKLMLEKK